MRSGSESISLATATPAMVIAAVVVRGYLRTAYLQLIHLILG